MDFSELRVGLVGAGGISHEHVRGWLALGARVSAYSRSGAAQLAAEYGIREVASLEELLEGCDIVDICTPTGTHAALVRAAITARVPIICEKPLALTADEAHALVTEAQDAGVALYPAHVVRFFPEYARAKQAVDAGDIGTVAVSRFRRAGEFPSWAPWFANDKDSGGIVLDQMIHDIDIAGWISGPVVRVFGTRSAPVDGSPAVSAQLQLSHANGAISYVTGVWGPPGMAFSTSFSIAGDCGVLEHDSRDDSTARVDLGRATSSASDRPDSALIESPYLSQLREFVSAWRGEQRARVTGSDGVTAVRVARAAIESIASGRVVVVDHEEVAA